MKFEQEEIEEINRSWPRKTVLGIPSIYVMYVM